MVGRSFLAVLHPIVGVVGVFALFLISAFAQPPIVDPGFYDGNYNLLYETNPAAATALIASILDEGDAYFAAVAPRLSSSPGRHGYSTKRNRCFEHPVYQGRRWKWVRLCGARPPPANKDLLRFRLVHEGLRNAVNRLRTLRASHRATLRRGLIPSAGTRLQLQQLKGAVVNNASAWIADPQSLPVVQKMLDNSTSPLAEYNRLPDNEGARPQHCTQVQAANFSQEAKECMCKPGPNNPWVVCSAQIQQEVKTATDEAFTALKRLTPKEREDLGRKLLELQPVVQRVLDDGARLEAFVGRVKTAVEAGHDVTFGLPAKVRPDGSLGVGNLGDHKPWLRDHNITSPHEQPFLELVQSSQLRSLKQQFSCGKFGSDFYSAINNLLKGNICVQCELKLPAPGPAKAFLEVKVTIKACLPKVEFRKFSKGEEVLCCFGTLCKYSCLSPEDCPNTPGFSAAGAALDALYSSYVTIELGLCFGGDAGKAIKPVLQLLGLELCFIKGSLQVYVFGKQLGYGVQISLFVLEIAVKGKVQLETNPKEVCTQERWTSNPAVFDYLKCKDYCVWQGGQGTTDLSICLRFLFWKVCWDWNLGADFTKPPYCDGKDITGVPTGAEPDAFFAVASKSELPYPPVCTSMRYPTYNREKMVAASKAGGWESTFRALPVPAELPGPEPDYNMFGGPTSPWWYRRLPESVAYLLDEPGLDIPNRVPLGSGGATNFVLTSRDGRFGARADLAANRLAIYHYEQQTERKIYTVGSKLDVPTTRGDPPNQEVLSYLSFITAAEAERLKPVDLGIEVDGGDLGFWYVKQGTTEARTWRWLLAPSDSRNCQNRRKKLLRMSSQGDLVMQNADTGTICWSTSEFELVPFRSPPSGPFFDLKWTRICDRRNQVLKPCPPGRVLFGEDQVPRGQFYPDRFPPVLYSRDASGPSKPNLFINEQWPMYPIADFDSGMVSSNQGYFAALRPYDGRLCIYSAPSVLSGRPNPFFCSAPFQGVLGTMVVEEFGDLVLYDATTKAPRQSLYVPTEFGKPTLPPIGAWWARLTSFGITDAGVSLELSDEGGLLYFDEAGVYINGTNLYSAYLYNNKLKCGVPNVPCASLAPSVKEFYRAPNDQQVLQIELRWQRSNEDFPNVDQVLVQATTNDAGGDTPSTYKASWSSPGLVSPDGRFMATVDKDARLRVWQSPTQVTGKRARRVFESPNPLNDGSVAFHFWPDLEFEPNTNTLREERFQGRSRYSFAAYDAFAGGWRLGCLVKSDGATPGKSPTPQQVTWCMYSAKQPGGDSLSLRVTNAGHLEVIDGFGDIMWSSGAWLWAEWGMCPLRYALITDKGGSPG